MLGGTLTPYTGPWTVKEAGHLMRRTTFGPSQAMIEEALSLGMDAAVDRLLNNEVTPPEPPIKWYLDAPHPNPAIRPFIPYVNDPEVKYGETWVNARLLPQTGDPNRDNDINNSRLLSMYSWMHHHMNKEVFSIREKMSVFCLWRMETASLLTLQLQAAGELFGHLLQVHLPSVPLQSGRLCQLLAAAAERRQGVHDA